MIRGTTPTFTFNLPFEASALKSAYITIKSHNIEIEKAISDCTIGEKSISTTLTQEETLKLTAGKRVKIQLRVLTEGGNALATEIYVVDAEDILKEGVIQ